MNTSYADLPSGDGQIQPGLFPSYGTNGSSDLGDAPLLPSDGFNNYVLDEEKKKEQKLSDESHKNLFAAEDFLASISPPSIGYKDGSGINIDLSSDSQIKLGDNAIKETSDFPEYNSSVEALFYDMPESAKIDRRNVYSKYFNPDGTAKQMEQFTEFLSKKKVDRNNNPSAAETHMYEYIANYANYIDFIDDLPAERKAAKKEALINAASDEINRLRSLQAVRNAGVGVIKSFTGVEDKVYFRYLDQSNIEVSILGDDGSVVKDDPSKTFTIKVPEVSKKKLSEYPIKDKFVEENLKKENKLKYKSESFPDIYDYFGVDKSGLNSSEGSGLTESDYVAYEKAKAAAEVGLFRDATPIEYAEREVRKALNDRNIQVGTMSYVKDLGYGALSALGQLQLFNRKTSGIEGILRKAGRNDIADAFLEESKDAAEGINIVRGLGSDLINPSEAQRIFSGSAKVVGEMVPTILVSIASRNPGALTEPFVSSLARMSPIAMQSYGQAYFERLSEADRLKAQADDLRAAGKSEDANRLYSESERLNSTAEVNAMMTAAREWGTEMIIPEHKIFSGTMKATFGNVAMSAALNPIEDIAADLLSVPQASLVGDLKPNLNLKETALISAVSAFGMSAPPAIASAAYSGANTIIGNVPLNLDLEKFGPSRNEVHSPVATSTNVGEFIKDKVEFPIQSPDQETTPYSNEDNLPSVTDENGSVFTKRGNSFISKSGNEIPIRESGKGHDLMVLLEESDPNWSEKEDNAVGLKPPATEAKPGKEAANGSQKEGGQKGETLLTPETKTPPDSVALGRSLLAKLAEISHSHIPAVAIESVIGGTFNGDFRGPGNATLDVDSDGNVVLRRFARDPSHLIKEGQRSGGAQDLWNTSEQHGGGNGVPTIGSARDVAGVPEGSYADYAIEGVFKIPSSEFLKLAQDGEILLGNIGESEIVISPAVAAKYLVETTNRTSEDTKTPPGSGQTAGGVSVQPSSFQDLTFRQAIDASIAEEFPSYDGVSNKKVVDSIEKTLHPVSYVWERFRDAGGKIKFNKSGRSSLYFDRSSNTLNVGLSNLSARKKGAIERWIAPAIQEEMDHFVISQAGINTRTIADLAPDEVRDAARLVYGKSYVNEDHEGDEILRMFMQGRIVKTNTGEWSIDGKSITESSAKGFFRVAKDAMATLVNSFSSVDADGETEFHKELSSAYSAASEKFQKIFGVPIEDHILSKELSMTSFSFRVKRSLYKMASSIGTLGDFAEEIISRLDRAGEDITPGKMDSIEKIGTLAMAAGKMSHPIDVSIDAILEDSKSGVLPNISVIDSQLSANNDSDSAGIVGSLKSKISMLKEALTNRANIASKEIVIKMGLFYNNVSSLIKWAGDLLGRGLSAVEKRLISLLSSVASSVAKLFKSFKSKAEEKPDDKKKDFIRMTWEFISASPALFSALVASTNGFTSFNEDAYNEVYRPLNIGQFSKVGKTAILLLELEKDIYNKRNEILGKIKSLSPDTMVIGRDDVAALHLLGEGDILFSLSPIGENVRAALTKKGVSIVVPNLSAIDTEGLGSKQWEQVVLGESGIKTVNVADTVMDILSNERPDLLERMEALEKEMNDAGENEEVISAVREKMKIVSSEMEAHYSGAEFQKKLRDEIVLAVGSENFVLKPVDGANSLGIRELNDRLQSDGFINPSFDGIDVIAQEYLDLDRKKSFRVHALNDNGRWHIVPASTFSRDVNDSGDYSLFPIVGGEYLNDAADAEEAALRILSSISDKQMDDRLLSLDLEWDNKLKSYRIMELNPTLGHGLGGYVGNFFVLDALVSMFTGKVPEMIKLAARSAEFNFDTGLRESSDADVRKNIPAVILPNRRTQAQRVAATHTYEKYPDVAKIVKDTYVRFLSERDKSTFDSLVNKNLNVDENDIPAIKKLLGDIKLRSDIEWFKAAQADFPEVLAGKELSEFNNDPREVRVEIRRAFTYEPGDDSAGNPYDAAFSRSDKNRKKNEEKVLSISSGIFERLQSFANDPDSEFSSFTKEQQAKIANGVALLVGTDLSSLSNKDLSRLKATLLNVAEGDFLGFHDLVSKFHAMNFAAYLSSLVSSGGDIFSDPSYKPNRALYTKGARIKSIFRSIEANAFFDHVYMRYMADKAKYHSDIYSADRRIRIFFDQNKTSVDESLAAGIAAVLTQYIADNDSIELFEKKLRDVRHSISNMQGELADVSVRVKGGAASAILQRLLSGIDFSTLVNASDARAIIEKNLTRAERKVLDFARREFAKNKSQIKYIKTVVFGEKFDDIENYVHLMVRSVNFSPDEKGNVTKALGTQESALKDRRGLSNDGLTYYDMDIGTMLFDGQSDHMYEINTAEHRLILSHLHPGPVAQSSLSKGYAALFAGKRDVAQNRYIELSNILREIHSSVTTAAFVPNGMLGVALRGVERGATFINALKLIDPRNIGAQFASAAIGLGAYIVSGKIRPSSFGMAMLFVGANFKPQRNNVKNILRGIVPGIVSRSENPDAQFDFTREASPRSFQVNTRLHKSIVRKSIAAIERAIQFPVSVVENIVTGAARFINGSPDGAIASIIFLSSYVNNYENITGKKISSPTDLEAILSDPNFDAVYKATTDVDSIMGNPSDPEMRGKMFEGKTFSARIIKSAMLLFRQTQIGISSNSISGLKTAIASGDNASKSGLVNRFHGAVDFVQGVAQFVVFDLIKRWSYPALITAAIISLFKKDDDELNDVEKAARDSALNVAIKLKEARASLEARQAIKSVVFSQDNNLKYSRRKLLEYIQSFFPVVNNDAGDVAGNFLIDSYYGDSSRDFWIQQEAKIAFDIATITARKPKDKKEADENSRLLLGLRAMLELAKSEKRSSLPGASERMAKHGGSYSSFMELVSMAYEMQSDGPFLKKLRRAFFTRIPVFRDAVTAVEKAEEKTSESVLEKNNKKRMETELKIDALRYLKQ